MIQNVSKIYFQNLIDRCTKILWY